MYMLSTLFFSSNALAFKQLNEALILEIGFQPAEGIPELSEADMIVFLGDLNYRLDDISYDEARDFVSQRCFDWLRERDQLRETKSLASSYEMSSRR